MGEWLGVGVHSESVGRGGLVSGGGMACGEGGKRRKIPDKATYSNGERPGGENTDINCFCFNSPFHFIPPEIHVHDQPTGTPYIYYIVLLPLSVRHIISFP